MKWADLLRRVFEIDVLACARCGGRLRFVAAIDDPEAIRRILGQLGFPTSITPTLPARPPPVGERRRSTAGDADTEGATPAAGRGPELGVRRVAGSTGVRACPKPCDSVLTRFP